MSILLKFDLLGVPATLNFFGDEKKRSNFGAICSILFVGFVAWTVYNSSLDLIKRTNPKIALSEIIVEDARELDISLDRFPIALIVKGSKPFNNATSFRNESIYSLSVNHVVIQRVQQPDGSHKRILTSTPLEVGPCSKEHFGEYASRFASFDFQGSYCVSKNQTSREQLKLQGMGSSAVYQTISASVKLCDNSTATCGTPEEMNKAMSGGLLNVLYLDSMVDVQNSYTKPIGKYRDMYTTIMNSDSYKEVNIEVGPLEIETDVGLFTEQLRTERSLKVNKVREMVDPNLNAEKIVLDCIFQASRMETYYKRSYKKIATVLAEVGGLAYVVMGILLIIISPYQKLKFKEALMNEVFDVEGNLANQRKLNRLRSFTYERRSTPKKVRIEEDRDAKNKGESKERVNPLRKTVTTETNVSRDTYLIYPNEILETPRKNLTSEKSLQNQSFPQEDLTIQSIFDGPKKKGVQHPQNESPSNYRRSSLTLTHTKSISIPRLISEKVARMGGDKLQEKEFDQMIYKKEEFEDDDIEKQLKNIETMKRKEKVDGTESPPSDDRSACCTDREYRTEPDKEESVNVQPKLKGALKNGYKPETLDLSKDIKLNANTNIELHLWEYMLSFIYKPKGLRKKIKIIEEGVKNIDERLDVSNVLKKFCEGDKLIKLILDRDQLELFRHVPKPPLQSEKKDISKLKNEEYMQSAYERIRQKPNKSEIDQKLMDMFNGEFM